jgi:hypothetical protein
MAVGGALAGRIDGHCHLVGSRRRLAAVAVLGNDDKRPVHHVHAAGKAEAPLLVRHELDRRLCKGGQSLAHGEVGKDDARRAVARLLAVEGEPHRDALAQLDHVGRVAALDRDLDLLHALAHLGPAGTLRAEEEPGEEDDEGCAAGGDRYLGNVHDLPSLSDPSRCVKPLPTLRFSSRRRDNCAYVVKEVLGR